MAQRILKERIGDWVNIVYNGVPYDITKGCSAFDVSMEGGLHRIHTLGHDPILGWIFGTMNILSDTITLEDFRTFSVCMQKGHKRWTALVQLPCAFTEAVDSIREDSRRLPAALFAQALHLESDIFTKQGLPVPVLEAFDPEFAGKVYKEGYDTLLLMKDIAVVGAQAVASVMINMLIAALHGLFYDAAKYPNRALFEVKTRKILSISNAIASSSNLIWVGGNAWMGNESAWKDIDIGGILVTAYRLVTDTQFIMRIKKEYLESEWKNKVVGEEYSFMAEEALMSKKDIRKGIEIQARADAAKQDKVASGLEKQAEILQGIETNQREVQGTVEFVLNDMAAQEARELYGIEANKTPRELGGLEQQALCATLYTLMDQYGQGTDYQRAFYLNLEKYLGVTKRVSNFDFEKLSNVDSHSDRRVILNVICAFLFLGETDFSFKNDHERFGWLSRFTSTKEVDAACEEIQKEFSILGADGIVNRYKAIAAPQTENVIEAAATDVEEEGSSAPVLDENSYSGLKRIIGSYLTDEASFGKKLESLPEVLQRELHKTFPRLSFGTFLYGTKIGNGYLLFSTHAIYVKEGTGFKSTYLRIPYASIISDRIATAAGRVAGTRKLLIPCKSEDGSEKVITIDDSKLTEERLQALLKEIISSGVQIAETDFALDLPELSTEEKLLYFKALGSILVRNGRSLTELYLIVQDYGLEKKWNEMAMAFTDNDAFSGCVQVFIDKIPYPSAERISQQAIMLALQTLFRTNYIEKKEISMLSAETETLIRMFDIGETDNKRFNEMIRVAAASKRKPDLQTCFDLRERLPKETLFREKISDGLNAMISDLEQTIQDKKKTVPEQIKYVAQNFPENAEKVFGNAVRFMDGFRKGGKKETLTLPSGYQKIKKKFPEGIGIPQNAVGYEMRTEGASCLLISYPVTEEASMPFDDPQWVIDEQHRNMGDNEGIIEVVSGTTSSGRPYIYEIVKHRIAADDIAHGVEYTFNINVRMENSIQFINGSFMEEGTTGVRDNVCMTIYSLANNLSLEEAMKDWFKDPYDPSFDRGFLMNRSERAEYDEKFPSHPLSEARALARFIAEHN